MTAVDTNSVMVGSSTRTSTPTSTDSGIIGNLNAWLMTSDHKRIGQLMVVFAVIWTVIIAVVGTLLAVERIDATSALVDSASMLQLFSLFRVGLIFGVMAPLMLGVAVAIVPMQIGAQALAFSRGALFGVYVWLFGMVIVGASYIGNGGPGGSDAQMVDLFMVGMGFVIAGLVIVGACIATTVLTARRPGMTLAQTPIFAWSALVTSVSLVLTLPVMAGVLVYLAIDHSYERVAFGGTDGIAGWIDWALTAPQIFLLAIPTLGILAQIVDTMSRGRQPIRGGLLIGIGIMSAALIGPVTQSSYSLQTEGLAELTKSLAPFLLFNVLPILGALIVLALCLLAIKKEKVKLDAAFVPAFLGVGMVLTGMIGNTAQRINNFELGNTVFEEAVLVYIGYGVVLSALGALAYFGPKLWGRTMPASQVIGLGLLGLLGVVLAALPYYIAGFAGQPASSASGFDYSGPTWLWNLVSAVGHAIFTVVVIVFIGLAVKSFRSGTIENDAVINSSLETATVN